MPRSSPLPSTTKIATNLVLALTLAVIACCLFTTPTYASGALSLGTLTVSDPVPCPGGGGWYSYTYTNSQNQSVTAYMTCRTATVSCPHTANLNVTFGFLNPFGIVNTQLTKGVIVYFTGDTGTAPGSTDYNDYYFRNGYEVVELAWADDWEMTYDPWPPGNVASIQNAACRPATLLNYVYNTLFVNGVQLSNSSAAMCAQGQSAGSGAVAYSLAYYGAGSYLDNVELLSGPVFSDLDQGCTWPNTPANNINPVTVCGQTNYNGGQFGCQLGGGSTWSLLPTYLSGANTGVSKWTNDVTCANANLNNTSTSTTSEMAWLKQSIVDQPSVSGGATPTFNYSGTGISGWLCRSVLNDQPHPYDCAANNNNNFNLCPNNSSPQAQVFYANIGFNNKPPNYNVYAVDLCTSAEGVVGGTVPGYAPAPGSTGFDAIRWDMAGNPAKNIPQQCVQRTH